MRREFTKKTLRNWDRTIPEGLRERIERQQSRRNFLKAASIAPAAIYLAACDNTTSTPTPTISQSLINEQAPWNTFSAVQNHLFPKDHESPGASDFNATGYLKTILELSDTNAEDKKFIADGINWTNDLSRQMFEQDFHQLNIERKEQVLQRIATSSAGESWLSLLLLYLFEALISDPVYGGNTNKIGWQWLEHIPGFPLPPEDKKYYLLR